MEVFLHSVATALPAYAYRQGDILNYMLAAAPDDTRVRRSLSAIYSSSGIDTRHSVLPDFGQPGAGPFFDRNTIPDTATRMERYVSEAEKLTGSLLKNAEKQGFEPESISHLIWVSCTGLTAPGMETRLLKHFGFSQNIQTTAFNFLGCHGFFHAMRHARALVAENEENQVLIVCAELCTLHFQPKWDADHLLANAIFGDGAAMAVVSAHPRPQSIRIKTQSQSFFHQASDDMTWNIGAHGFDMRLSQELPHQVEAAMEKTIEKLLEKAGFQFHELVHFVIHPGGKRILDKAEEALSLPQHKLAASRMALQLFGNVSSASILFALEQFLRSHPGPVSGAGLMLGVGPGLCLETALFEV